jgi:ABC-type transporter lipoprotein component MlaA
MTDPEKVKNFEASLGMLGLMTSSSAMTMEKAIVAFEIQKDEDFGTWGVTKVNHSVLGKLDDKSLGDRTTCAITPTQFSCAEVSGS